MPSTEPPVLFVANPADAHLQAQHYADRLPRELRVYVVDEADTRHEFAIDVVVAGVRELKAAPLPLVHYPGSLVEADNRTGTYDPHGLGACMVEGECSSEILVVNCPNCRAVLQGIVDRATTASP